MIIFFSVINSCKKEAPQPPETLWEKRFGGGGNDVGYSILQNADGDYIIVGYTDSYGAGNEDVYLIKTNENGDTLLTRTFGGSSDDLGYSVQQTSDKGYIIVGYTYTFGAGSKDVFLIKTDANCDEIWTKTYGGPDGDEGNSVQQTSDGGYIIVGSTNSFGAGNNDVWLIKTDANGDTLWTKTFGGSNWDVGYSVLQTNDGEYIVSGSTRSVSGSDADFYLIKTDANGGTLWTKTYGGEYDDRGLSVRQTSDGGYVIAGHLNIYLGLVKTDASGNQLWTNTYDGTKLWWGNIVQQTSDGGYIIVGMISSVGVPADAYLIKTEENGSEIWTKTFGGEDYDYGSSVHQTSDGGYIIVGWTESSGKDDIYLIRVEAESGSE